MIDKRKKELDKMAMEKRTFYELWWTKAEREADTKRTQELLLALYHPDGTLVIYSKENIK